MGQLITKNPWGASGGLDTLRKDLWVLDLGNASLNQPFAAFSSTSSTSMLAALQSSFPGQLTDISQDDLAVHAVSVTFPETRIGAEAFASNDNLPAMFPALDEPLQGVKVVFRVEYAGAGQVSRIVRVLTAWKDSARAGRLFATDQNAPPLLVKSSNDILFPPFLFDVSIRLYAGGSVVTGQSAQGMSVASSQLPLTPSWCILLRKTWCGGIQVSDLDYTSNGDPITISAQLYPQALVQQYNPEAVEYAASLLTGGGAINMNSEVT